jgi:uncharacterized protein YjbI with pentapeptide repeats
MADAKKIDPFDVEALEKSLNDSATRVSTIWVSFLIFSLYLLTAATTVTHRQLFLAEPVKLPVLNIDLPLWGFFWLAPILFVVFHAYVLIQLILLARTAAAYDAAVAKLVEQDNLSPEANASLRQRLANTLFAQILAGSPREREGWFGSLLKAMAWITLVIAPILILLTFQFIFLPYHSHLATWTHRLLILLELVVAFKVWPLVLNPQRDFQWPAWRLRINRRVIGGTSLFRSSEGWLRVKQDLPRLTRLMAAITLFISLSLSLATFPGEPHVNIVSGSPAWAVQCDRWVQRDFGFIDLQFDRVRIPSADIIDYEKLNRIIEANTKAKLRPSEGERTRAFRRRNLSCADLTKMDLRRVDLTGVDMQGAYLSNSELSGALLEDSDLRGAHFFETKLQGASLAKASSQKADFSGAVLTAATLNGASVDNTSFDHAQLQSTSFLKATLRGSKFDGASAQGANFSGADLSGSSFSAANFQASSFAEYLGTSTRLQGTLFEDTRLQAVDFSHAKLQGATFIRSHIQGANFSSADLTAAYFMDVQLQGSQFENVHLDDAAMSGARLWRATKTYCGNMLVTAPKFDIVVETEFRYDLSDFQYHEHPVEATPAAVARFIYDIVREVPENTKDTVREKLSSLSTTAGSATDEKEQESREAWMSCSEVKHDKNYEIELAKKRADFVCFGDASSVHSIKGITRNILFADSPLSYDARKAFARQLLDARCWRAGRMDEFDVPSWNVWDRSTLRSIAGRD